MPIRVELATLCIVSEVDVALDLAATSESIATFRASGTKCERCWFYRPDVGQSVLYPTLCDRCAQVVSAINAAEGTSKAPG
jgi:isoleucyl-tRNA synthetase